MQLDCEVNCMIGNRKRYVCVQCIDVFVLLLCFIVGNYSGEELLLY